MISGITVLLHQKTVIATNPFGEPVYNESESVPVENVLVGLPTPEEKVNEINLTGKSIAYTLGIPKGDTHDWEDTIVEFFGEKFRTFGIPEFGIESNIPLSWHKKVKCERYE